MSERFDVRGALGNASIIPHAAENEAHSISWNALASVSRERRLNSEPDASAFRLISRHFIFRRARYKTVGSVFGRPQGGHSNLDRDHLRRGTRVVLGHFQ